MKSTSPSMLMLALSSALAVLASCAPIPASDPCAGWQPITGALASVDYLATHDPQFLRAVIAHDEFGAKIGCWK